MNENKEIQYQTKSNLKEKINSLLKSCYISYNSNPELVIENTEKAIKFANQISEQDLLAESIRMNGVAYYIKAEYDLALQQYNKALNIFQKNYHLKGIADSLFNISYIFKVKGEHDKALEYLFRSVKIREQLEDEKGLLVAYNAIGLNFWLSGNNKRALEFYEKTMQLAEKQNDSIMISKACNNIGIIYRRNNKLSQALDYYFKALKIKKQIGEKMPIANSYQNIGVIYIEKEDYNKAYEYTKKALDLMREVGSNNGIARAKLNLGLICISNQDFAIAEKYLLKAQKTIAKIEAKQLEMICYDYLTVLYEEEKDFKKALEYCRKYYELEKKLFNESKEKRILEITKKYEYEKEEKEKQIYRLKNIELKKVNDAKDKFFSIVAHDLKNPFLTIISFIRIMKNSLDKYDKNRILDLVQELEKSTNNTFALLENLLEWSRLQLGAITFNPKLFAIDNIIIDLVKNVQPLANQKKIEITTELQEKAYVFADINMIKMVIRNLLSNAIKFTYSGGSIKISTTEENGKINVSIQDNGIGIKHQDLSRLFKIDSNFSRIGTAEEKGTGLGLILVKEFLAKNNSKIRVESEFGKGTKFFFTLPQRRY